MARKHKTAYLKINQSRKTQKLRQRGGATFRCPKCLEVSRVLRTIRAEPGNKIIRQRQCLKCEEIFTTREIQER